MQYGYWITLKFSMIPTYIVVLYVAGIYAEMLINHIRGGKKA